VVREGTARAESNSTLSQKGRMVTEDRNKKKMMTGSESQLKALEEETWENLET